MRKLLASSLALVAMGAALSGCATLFEAGSFKTAWDACIESFEHQPMRQWEDGEIVETVPATRSCSAYVEDLGNDEFALSFNTPMWVAAKEDNRRIMDVYNDGRRSDGD